MQLFLANTLLCYFLWPFIMANAQESFQTQLRLRQGNIKGILVEADNRQVHAYLGIPYARAPVGNRRFKLPEPHSGWTGTYDASKFGPICAQPLQSGVPMSEDCLTINVWTPMIGSLRQTPVVVLLEGEMFVTSNPNRFPGQDLAIYNLIVVTLNYRVNAFGFLSWQDRILPGNLGLHDQLLALRWISENIDVFGGDVNRITLIGHSAGAASVAYHLSSEHSRVLFQRAVLLSGTSLSPWAMSRYPKSAAVNLAKELGCQFNTTDVRTSTYMVKCLQKSQITFNEITNKVEKMIESGNPHYLFAPVVDSHVSAELRFIEKGGPVRLMETIPSNIPVLMGISEFDGSVMLYLKREINYMSYSYLRRYGKEVLVPLINSLGGHEGPAMPMLNHLVDFTFLQKSPGGNKMELIKATVQLFTDAFFTAPVLSTVNVLSRRGVDLHLFVNDFVTPDIYHGSTNITGALHGGDLAYLFGPSAYTNIFRRPMQYEEAKTSETLKKMIYSFAIRGEPTLGVSYPPPRWEHYTTRDPVYAMIPSGQIHSGYREHDVAFWSYLLPDLGDIAPKLLPLPPIVTYPPRTTTTNAPVPSPAIGKDTTAYQSAVWILLSLVAVMFFAIVSYFICARRRQRLSSATLHGS